MNTPILYRLLLLILLSTSTPLIAQIETGAPDTSQTPTLYVSNDTNFLQEALNAFELEDYRSCLYFLDRHEATEGWVTSVGYWRIKAIDRLLHYDNISDPLFVKLTQECQKLIDEANTLDTESRSLQEQHYIEIISIDEKINFAVLLLKWANDNHYQKALKAFEAKDYGVAKGHAETAAKSQNGSALLLLGQLNEIGWSANPQNFEAAMKYYQEAYLAGSYYAAYHIGYLYFHGLGVLKNINIAFHWCELAANYKYIPAMKELSNMYKHGLGVVKNPEKSAYWWALSEKK